MILLVAGCVPAVPATNLPNGGVPAAPMPSTPSTGAPGQMAPQPPTSVQPLSIALVFPAGTLGLLQTGLKIQATMTDNELSSANMARLAVTVDGNPIPASKLAFSNLQWDSTGSIRATLNIAGEPLPPGSRCGLLTVTACQPLPEIGSLIEATATGRSNINVGVQFRSPMAVKAAPKLSGNVANLKYDLLNAATGDSLVATQTQPGTSYTFEGVADGTYKIQVTALDAGSATINQGPPIGGDHRQQRQRHLSGRRAPHDDRAPAQRHR